MNSIKRFFIDKKKYCLELIKDYIENDKSTNTQLLEINNGKTIEEKQQSILNLVNFELSHDKDKLKKLFKDLNNKDTDKDKVIEDVIENSIIQYGKNNLFIQKDSDFAQKNIRAYTLESKKDKETDDTLAVANANYRMSNAQPAPNNNLTGGKTKKSCKRKSKKNRTKHRKKQYK